MITILPKSDEQTLGIKASGRLEEEDYEAIKTEIDLRTDKHDKPISMVVNIESIEGMTLQAVVEDLSMMSHMDQVDKMATITRNDKWEAVTKAVGKPIGTLMGIDVKHFEPEAAEAAWSWAQA